MEHQGLTDNLQDGRRPSPPYVPYLTFKNLLEWLGTEGVPLRFDRSFWGKRYNSSTGSQLMSGIRFLGLLIDDKPTPLLEKLVDANGENRKESLRDIYRTAYGAVDFDDLQRATSGMLTEWFKAYAIDGTTLRKAESFFINALKDADAPLSNSLKKLARNKVTGGSASSVPGSRKGRAKKDPPPNPPQGRGGATPTPETPVDEAAAQTSLMLRGLFKSLPSPGSNFPSSQRTSWLEAAKALFNLEYTDGEKAVLSPHLMKGGDKPCDSSTSEPP